MSQGVHTVFSSIFRRAQEENKKIVLAGCVPQAQPRQDYLQGLSVIGVSLYLMGEKESLMLLKHEITPYSIFCFYFTYKLCYTYECPQYTSPIA